MISKKYRNTNSEGKTLLHPLEAGDGFDVSERRDIHYSFNGKGK
jgi:hypothetical protein